MELCQVTSPEFTTLVITNHNTLSATRTSWKRAERSLPLIAFVVFGSSGKIKIRLMGLQVTGDTVQAGIDKLVVVLRHILHVSGSD
jgi:hypothetical protein